MAKPATITNRTMLTGVAASLGLILAACGGAPSHSGVASLSHGKATTTAPAGAPAGTANNSGAGTAGAPPRGGQQLAIGGASYTQALKFSQCMRSHGVVDFPDPSPSGAIQFGPGSGINKGSAQFQSAEKACQKFLPNGGQPTPAERARLLAQALRFSQCMRSHGLADFPDPSTQGGGIAIRISANGRNSDLNPNSPQFQAAQRACQGIIGK